MADGVSLSEAAAVLGVDKSTVSRIRSGTYDRPGSALPQQYAALVRLVERKLAAHAPSLREVPQAELAAELCRRCPREECAGCRAAEV